MDQKNGAQVKGVFFFVLFFFSKNEYFKSGFQKKWSVLIFFSLAGFLFKKKWYQSSRIRAVSGPKPEISYFFILFYS